MTRTEFCKRVKAIYDETIKDLEEIKKVEVSGDNMVNTDIEKTIKAQSFQKLDELFRRVKNGK